jgi:hypothetical protein
MEQKYTKLVTRFAPHGIIMAGELLLPPSEANELAEEMKRLGVFIVAANFWHYVGEQLAENPAWLDLMADAAKENGVELAAEGTREFISKYLPPDTAFVSFVVDDARWFEAIQRYPLN